MSNLSFLRKKKKKGYPKPKPKTTEEAIEELRYNMDFVDFEMMMAGYSQRNALINPGPEFDRG